MVNVGAIFSTLGNPNSLVPLAVKDMSATAGMTASSFVTGKEEGQDRLIDELGTQALWLFGIPGYKWLFDKTIFKAYGLDAKFDVRNLKNKDIFEKIKEYAPTEEIKQGIEKIGQKQGTFKNVALWKFFISTGATIATYIGLTRGKQAYTENKIRQNLIKEYNAKQSKEADNKNNGKNPSFKGVEGDKFDTKNSTSFRGVGDVVKNFAFSPVRNMWILDGAITGERLADSRTPQEFVGYSIKEGSLLFFMYYAGGKIQEYFENRANKKYNKSIGLDARVIEDNSVLKVFEDGSIEKSLKEFKEVADLKDDAKLYEFIHKNPDNEIVKVAKKSDLIAFHKETGKIDTRKYIDLEDIKGVNNKLETLYKQYKEAILNGQTSEAFFKGVKKLKRHSIVMNIGSCILALGVLTPMAMLGKRLFGKDDAEFQTKKEIREQLIREGVIS